MLDGRLLLDDLPPVDARDVHKERHALDEVGECERKPVAEQPEIRGVHECNCGRQSKRIVDYKEHDRREREHAHRSQHCDVPDHYEVACGQGTHKNVVEWLELEVIGLNKFNN